MEAVFPALRAGLLEDHGRRILDDFVLPTKPESVMVEKFGRRVAGGKDSVVEEAL
jgi:hypothetical protein